MTRHVHRCRAGLWLLIMATLSCVGEPKPEPLALEPGVPWELAEHRRTTLSGLRYAFELVVPPEVDHPIRGVGRIRFQWFDPASRPLVLDFLEPRKLHWVRLNGRQQGFEVVNDHIVVPSDSLQQGRENTLVFGFIAGDGSLNRGEEFLYTLFVPERARFAVPVFDQPNLKGRFAVTLTVPEEWTAVANGPLVGESSGNDGQGRPVTTLTFAESRPLPTYLFGFAAGRFQVERSERDGREIRLLHRETDSAKVERNLDRIFDLHATALAWMEDYTGIEYPFQKFDFVAIPSFQYGGMEHAGAILYRASSLFLDESATQGQQLGRASVIAHETAHMWFGDLVTMDWFDDVWMKEVFANFMASKIVEPSFPEIDHDLRFLSHHQSAYEVDRTAGANPIRQPLDNLREAGTLYGPIIYQKAPVVMQLLERMVGPETFREAMRHYLAAFEYENASWLDLVSILDVLSPADVAAWSRVWVEDAGRPEVTATTELDDDGAVRAVVLEQRDPRGEGRVWPQPLGVGLGYGTRVERVTVPLFERRGREVLADPAAPPDFVLPESEALGYGYFRLDEASRAVLVDRVVAIEDPLVRGVAWLTLWDAVLGGELSADRFVESALEGVADEEDELNLERILGFLETTYWTLLSDARRRDVAPAVERALWSRLERTEQTTRKASLFATYRDVAETSEAVGRLRRIWEGSEVVAGLPLSETDLTSLAHELAVREVDGWSEILDRQGERIENPDRHARFTFVRPALSADPEVRAAWFHALGEAKHREREPWVLTGLSYLHHPLRRDTAWRFVQPSLELVEEIQRTGDIFFPARWLNTTLGSYNSPEVVTTVAAFLESRPDYPSRLRAKILQAADPVERAARILHGSEQPPSSLSTPGSGGTG